MPFWKYLSEHLYDRDARKWWSNYLKGSIILRRIGRYLIYCGVLHIIFFWKPIVALLIIFTASTILNLYAVVYALRKSAVYVEARVYPSDTMTGYLLLGVFRFIFGATLLIPAYIGLSAVLEEPVTLLTFLVTYTFSIPAWAFYLVIKSLERNDDEG